MITKWYKTVDDGNKSLDCKSIERTIIEALEGRRECITEVIFGEQYTVKSYRESSYDTGYAFILDNTASIELTTFNYVCLEEWKSTLFVYVTDIKPDME